MAESITTPNDRRLTELYPGLDRLAADYYAQHQEVGSEALAVIRWIDRLVDLSTGSRRVVVVGCGPKPIAMQQLLEAGYDAVGVEPVPLMAEDARRFLGDPSRVATAAAEALPYPDGSCRVVLLENVLEHVDSPLATINEAYRVLEPGGVCYIYTTNRYRLSLTGKNFEYRVPFYNWFPETLKEAYVHHHLHFDPRLANYSVRPAVHWWSYADLCRLGRLAGFAYFYSRLDVLEPPPPNGMRSRVRHAVLERVRKSPWLRAMALLQFGNSIFMVKRRDAAP
ncbi:methyltransferase [Gemmatirosa kalamazoonensis]|uniref:Methyltransferase n=1 Tax=Gemmatirosa kalamazoonensis TaxID=861299 RepID=W0RL34_9BACT|nr:class I SAM-dependent methyltransferase [Gemmatirosa kalamazoonensis]AHG91040.1 methyltransferase [Gemmatirosa kalamazoonensis]